VGGGKGVVAPRHAWEEGSGNRRRRAQEAWPSDSIFTTTRPRKKFWKKRDDELVWEKPKNQRKKEIKKDWSRLQHCFTGKSASDRPKNTLGDNSAQGRKKEGRKTCRTQI